MAERMIEANGVELCTESFGDPADPPILLVMGIGGSMLWWEEGFCRMLAEGGRFVIRYDHRDTGRSVTYEPGRPEYTGADLIADAVGMLDAYGIPAAHVVGVSAGGAFAQLLALDYPDRVLSLVLISTSPATPGERGLPSATERYQRFVASANVDWSDETSVIEYLVGYARVLAGGVRPFDEAAMRGACPSRRRARAQHRRLREPRPGRGGRGAARGAVRDRRPHIGDPRHGGSDVPARARRGAGRGDPRCTAAHARGSRARSRASRLGDHRPRHPRAWKPVRYAAAGGPNQVVSASTSPSWVRSPTQATYPSGRINTAVGAVTAPIAGSSHVPTYLASIN